MRNNKRSPSRWFYLIAMLVMLCGMLISAWTFKASGIEKYPAVIADSYSEEVHSLTVPGSKEVELTRNGAYGFYYATSLVSSIRHPSQKIPPAIDCTLTSKTTGAAVKAVPDYVETNQYWLKDPGDPRVLIMSLTVDQPDTYTFACHYQDGGKGPELVVALGPNYAWEFLRVAWKLSLPLLVAVSISCASMLSGLILVVVVVIKRGGL